MLFVSPVLFSVTCFVNTSFKVLLSINEKGQTIASSITDQNGAYIFNNLTAGNYIVVFLYDMASYDVTSYGAEDQTKNNDAVTMNINIEGTQTLDFHLFLSTNLHLFQN